jgi:hypothetical protein
VRVDCNFRKEKPENFEVRELKSGLGQDMGEALLLHRILVVVLELLPVASMTEISQSKLVKGLRTYHRNNVFKRRYFRAVIKETRRVVKRSSVDLRSRTPDK